MLLLVNLVLSYFRQAVLDQPANFVLFEWLFPGVPGDVMVLLIIPDWKMVVLIQIKHFMHMFILLFYAHLILILDAILDIKGVIIKHTMMLLSHVSAHNKPKLMIKVNTFFLGSDLSLLQSRPSALNKYHKLSKVTFPGLPKFH